MLTRDFYLRDANIVAPELLGKRLVHEAPEGLASGIIVEVESYVGPDDKGAHTYLSRRTPRTEILFGPGGYAYIYTIYGMHTCFNVATNIEMKPETVFVRALEPLEGVELMAQRRKTKNRMALCSGPGKLCQAMGITKAQYGMDLCSSQLYIEQCLDIDKGQIMVSPRINIDYAEECKDFLWRYFIKDNQFVSSVAKKYKDQCKALT